MKKVLVVETDAVTARRMGEFWQGAGFEVCVITEPGRAAYEAARWLPDLITVDLEGAPLACTELLRQLQARPQTSRTPVVLLTASERNRLPEILLRSVRMVLEKPLRLEKMLNGFSELAPAHSV